MFNLAGLLGILFMVVGIIVSIALHELGHLWPAKKFGALVPEYMIGFGTPLYRRRVGETVYGIKLFLLGGYCKILGMYGPPRANQKIYRRGWQRLTAQEYQQLSPAEQAQTQETLAQAARVASLSELPDDAADRAYYLLPVRHKLAIIFGGPVMNLLISVVLTFVALCGIGVAGPSTTVGEAVCYPNGSEQQSLRAVPCGSQGAVPSPAAAAGLRSGDKIVAWNGEKITRWEQVRSRAKATDGSAKLTILRAGKEQTVTVSNLQHRLGVMSQLQQQRQPVSMALKLVKEQFVQTSAVVLRLPVAVWNVGKSLFLGQERDKTGVMSIVGAGRIAGEVADSGQTSVANRVSALIMLLASLNMALFVFNLIPLPPLDGGHIASALWQGIKQLWAGFRKQPAPGPVDAAAAMPLTYTVVAFFALMTVLLVVADIVDPIRLM